MVIAFVATAIFFTLFGYFICALLTTASHREQNRQVWAMIVQQGPNQRHAHKVNDWGEQIERRWDES